MGDESKPAQPGDDKQATTPGVEMANDDGADPTSDIEKQNITPKINYGGKSVHRGSDGNG